MPKHEIISLSEMKSGQEGIVTEIIGGEDVVRRLDALGVRSGKIIKKISSSLRRGPLVFEVEKTQIAVGRGIAQKILIKI
jgi:ferrous iron transport protein A